MVVVVVCCSSFGRGCSRGRGEEHEGAEAGLGVSLEGGVQW